MDGLSCLIDRSLHELNPPHPSFFSYPLEDCRAAASTPWYHCSLHPLVPCAPSFLHSQGGCTGRQTLERSSGPGGYIDHPFLMSMLDWGSLFRYYRSDCSYQSTVLFKVDFHRLCPIHSKYNKVMDLKILRCLYQTLPLQSLY